MEMSSVQSVSHAKLPSIFNSKPPLLGVHNNSVSVQSHKSFSTQALQFGFQIKTRNLRSTVGVIHASQAEATDTDTAQERWLLYPVGDGDSKHIGYSVKMPAAFEIASNEVTVGRLPEKADMVIPVATVSGLHARIQKGDGYLLVTDLDSTNGTYIDDKRLKPGVVAPVSSGSCIVFGDIHLAMFRVSKLEDVESADKKDETEGDQKTDETTEGTEKPTAKKPEVIGIDAAQE